MTLVRLSGRSLALAAGARRLLHASAPRSAAVGDIWYGPEKVAGREIVGFGWNGDPQYGDRLDYWYPAVRFKKPDDTYKKLHQKELGDWKNLSMEEKKQLYRYSFRQTYAEFQAPMGYWKPVVTMVLYVLSIGLYLFWFVHKYVMPPPPPTFSKEWKEAMLQRAIDMRAGHITGIASKWDYEKGQWKA